MNYGKSAYLKVVELEKKIGENNQQFSNKNGYLEFDKPKLNETILNQIHTEEFPEISLEQNKDICLQIQVCVSSSNQDSLKTKICLNETIIHEENTQISSGYNEFMVIKSFTPISSTSQKLSLIFENELSSNSVKILSVKVIILGLSNLSSNDKIEMNALVFGENIIVSYVDSGILYYQICNPKPQSISKEKFVKYSKAISHCFMKKSVSATQNSDLYLLIVDSENNLKLVSPFSSSQPIYIDNNVSFVTGTLLENHEDQNLICYIKNGEVFYSTITDGKVIKGRKIPLDGSDFKEICIATNSESEYVFLIATNEQNSSYILRSLLETASGKFVETISVNYMVKVSKYIDMELCDKKSVEHLSLLANFLISPYILFDNFIGKKSISTLKCSLDYSAVEYFYEDTFLYGVKLDKNNPDPTSWATYTDDAVGFEPAYMDFENDVFVDNGWKSRWPFKRFKPCLYNKFTHKVDKYIDKENYLKYDNGEPSNIQNRSSKLVFVEFPRMYYRISTDENYIYIQITNKEREGFVSYAFDCFQVKNDHIYVSAYLGNIDFSTDIGYSVYSGKEIFLQENKSWDTITRNLISYGYYCYSLPFPIYTLFQCLFIIMFKSTDVRNKFGVGVTEKKDHYYAGELDTKGMYYGSNKSGRIKLFGIEDLYGLTRIISGGLEIKSDGKWYWHDPTTRGHYGGTSSKLYSEVTGEKVILPHLSSEERYVTVNISGDTRLGFFGVNNETNQDKTKGFCETSCASVPGHAIALGNKEGQGGGLFSCEVVSSEDETTLATRVCFYDKLVKN